jgi:hypothetical protein
VDGTQGLKIAQDLGVVLMKVQRRSGVIGDNDNNGIFVRIITLYDYFTCFFFDDDDDGAGLGRWFY